MFQFEINDRLVNRGKLKKLLGPSRFSTAPGADDIEFGAGRLSAKIYLSVMGTHALQNCYSDWMNRIIAAPGLVLPVGGPDGMTALLCWPDGRPVLRIAEAAVSSLSDLKNLEDLARHHGARRIETQGKFVADGQASHVMQRHGFRLNGPAIVDFRVRVDRATEQLSDLGARLGGRSTPNASLADHITRVAAIAHNEELLDDFELLARLAQVGPGGISAEECPVIADKAGLAAFALVGQMADPHSRELMVRWVAPRLRWTAVANLALIVDCLRRAAAKGVVTAYFSANPDRHSDTLALARTLGADVYGTSVMLVRDLG